MYEMDHTTQDDTLLPAEALNQFMLDTFEAIGVEPEHGADAAEVLMYASRRGVDTHGIRNLRPIYVSQHEDKLLNLSPKFAIEHETPTSARVNGDRGLGLAAGYWGMRLAMEKAEQSGIGLVSMCNSWHYGAAGFYPWLAAQKDMIGISMTARFSPSGQGVVVRPTYATIPMFSTNPIAISFPTAQEPLYILDMATSISPFNRILKLRDAGQSIPVGWGLDEHGQPTVDPGLVRSLLPLGGPPELGGHKGYGLSMMVEVLCAVLSGGWADGFDDEHSYDGHRQTSDAHFFGALRVDLFRPAEDFKRGMDAMIRALHAAPKEPGQERIYVAGEIEYETEQRRLREGIPLPPTVVADMRYIADTYGVSLPF